MEKLRNFIIFYHCQNSNKLCDGNYTSKNRLTFPNRKECCEWIEKTNNFIFSIDEIVITNIIELTEDDLNNWNK